MAQATTTPGEAGAIFEDTVASSGQSGPPDTRIVVTDSSVRAEPIDPEETQSSLAFEVPIEDVEALRCSGVLDRTITLTVGEESHTIPTNQLDRRGFIAAVVDNSSLTNPCQSVVLGETTERICERLTCIGCAMILVGVGLSLSVVGLILGAPLIAIGTALILALFLRGKVCERRGTNVWRRPDSGSETAN